MEATFRQSRPQLADRLRHQAFRFDFFQAVRLLGKLDQSDESRIGTDSPASSEPVRFRSDPSLRFPSSDISGNRVTPGQPILEMMVSFFGLTGPAGVLPDYYTRLLSDTARDGNSSMHDFLDLFNHRLVSMFYRAWEKYRAEVGWEGAQQLGVADDFTNSLFSIVGLESPSARKRLRFEESTLAFYCGHLASHSRGSHDLESLLSDYFDVPVRLQQFCARWLYLQDEDTSQLPAAGSNAEGRFLTLGQDFVLGNRIRDIQSKFRLRIGPVSYQQFLRFLPIGDACQSLTDLVLLYAGNDQDFDLQPVLVAEEVPIMRLASDGEQPMYLGWNTWLTSGSMNSDPTNAIFSPIPVEANPAA